MGLRDLFKNLSSSVSPDLLDPLLKSAGIDACRFEYDPDSRLVVLALKIRGQTKFVCLNTGVTWTRAEICAAVARHLQDPGPRAAPDPHPPPT